VKSSVPKYILLLVTSAAISLTFYTQAGHLEEKNELLAKAAGDSLRIVLGYKDSIISFLRDSAHSPKNVVTSPTPTPPPIINVFPPASTTIIDQTPNPTSRGESDLFAYQRYPDNRQDAGKIDSATIKFNKLKQAQNQRVREALNALCFDNMGILQIDPRYVSRRMLDSTRPFIIGLLNVMDSCEKQLDSALQVSGLVQGSGQNAPNNGVVPPAPAAAGKSVILGTVGYRALGTGDVPIETYFRQNVLQLVKELSAKNPRLNVGNIIPQLRLICQLNQGQFNYFK